MQQTRRTPQLRHETRERNDTFPKNLGGVSDFETPRKTLAIDSANNAAADGVVAVTI